MKLRDLIVLAVAMFISLWSGIKIWSAQSPREHHHICPDPVPCECTP